MSTFDDAALTGLCQFARLATEADLTMAIEIEADGTSVWAASAPALSNARFNLARSGLTSHAWSGEPVDGAAFRLPTKLCRLIELTAQTWREGRTTAATARPPPRATMRSWWPSWSRGKPP